MSLDEEDFGLDEVYEDAEDEVTQCPYCHGSGHAIEGSSCDYCHGTGEL